MTILEALLLLSSLCLAIENFIAAGNCTAVVGIHLQSSTPLFGFLFCYYSALRYVQSNWKLLFKYNLRNWVLCSIFVFVHLESACSGCLNCLDSLLFCDIDYVLKRGIECPLIYAHIIISLLEIIPCLNNSLCCESILRVVCFQIQPLFGHIYFWKSPALCALEWA